MCTPRDTEDSSVPLSETMEASAPASLIEEQPKQQSPHIDSLEIHDDDGSLQAEMVTRRAPESCLERMREKNREWHKNGMCMVLLIAAVVFLIVDSTKLCIVPALLKDFLEWVEENPIPGIFAFTAVFLIATVVLIPGAILTLGAGYVFASAFGMFKGVLLGSISVFIGAVAGSLASFLLGRYLLRDWVNRLSSKYEKFEALNAALNEKGIRIMVLLRLSPAIPYNIVNYLCGLTGITLIEYTISLVALLPGTILYVFLGASAGSLATSNESGKGSTTTTIVIVVSVVCGIAAIGLTSYYAKRELDKITERKRQTQTLSATEIFTPEDSANGFGEEIAARIVSAMEDSAKSNLELREETNGRELSESKSKGQNQEDASSSISNNV